jgi:hypothetical protein
MSQSLTIAEKPLRDQTSKNKISWGSTGKSEARCAQLAVNSTRLDGAAGRRAGACGASNRGRDYAPQPCSITHSSISSLAPGPLRLHGDSRYPPSL